jgi:hypothetical protein
MPTLMVAPAYYFGPVRRYQPRVLWRLRVRVGIVMAAALTYSGDERRWRQRAGPLMGPYWFVADWCIAAFGCSLANREGFNLADRCSRVMLWRQVGSVRVIFGRRKAFGTPCSSHRPGVPLDASGRRPAPTLKRRSLR